MHVLFVNEHAKKLNLYLKFNVSVLQSLVALHCVNLTCVSGDLQL